jgi:hypothetical protein
MIAQPKDDKDVITFMLKRPIASQSVFLCEAVTNICMIHNGALVVVQPVLESSLDDGNRLLVIHASDVLLKQTSQVTLSLTWFKESR